MAEGASPALTTSDFRPPTPQARPRASGVLLHPTSLPGPHGAGDLGEGAYRFVDFLQAAGQTFWQIMPLGPVGLGYSPYAARSAFAGSPLLVALDQVVGRGWLAESDLDDPPGGAPERVEYDAAEAFKQRALRLASERFGSRASSAERAALDDFCARHDAWLSDFALFMALKEAHGGAAWFQWEPELVRREPAALAAARQRLAAEIRAQQLGQLFFFEQWAAIRRYAAERGVRIIGDIPIFVAHDSADVWVHQEIFHLDEFGQATAVAGVPPDLFSQTGQRWGNPLYRWDHLAERGYDWWIARFRGALELVDVVRLDHFRGFESYWEVPAEHETAERGRWVAGPGPALFEAAEASLGPLPIIVEDLGGITPEVQLLRSQLGYPGMKVLQFAFGDDAGNPYLPHNYTSPDCVVYTGTHDNDTTVGWFAALGEREQHAVRSYLGVDGQDIAWDLIRCALASVADRAIIPLQDVLALGGAARMNYPGRAANNWAWRYRPDQLQLAHAERLIKLTRIYGRLPAQNHEASTS